MRGEKRLRPKLEKGSRLKNTGFAAIGWDGDGETVPSQCEGVAYPIHAIGICAMGLYYADSLSFEDLAAAREEERRWEFFCVMAPLRIAP